MVNDAMNIQIPNDPNAITPFVDLPISSIACENGNADTTILNTVTKNKFTKFLIILIV